MPSKCHGCKYYCWTKTADGKHFIEGCSKNYSKPNVNCYEKREVKKNVKK